MPDEIPTPPAEIPTPASIPPESQTPPASIPAPPPAAALVVNGTKSEREIELERRLTAAEEKQRRAEIIAAEKEKEADALREIKSRPPAPPAPAAKRKRHWSDPVISNDE